MISSKQMQILAFPYSHYDALICDGAIRSGKTMIMMVAFVDWAMGAFNGQRFGICGKTVDSCAKNVIMPYMDMGYVRERYAIRWRRTDKLLEIRSGRAQNVFEVFGGKDESSYTLIQGRTLAGVLLDEVALQPRSFVEQALARCSVSGSKLWFNCNPAAPSHWFYKEWIQQPKAHNALRLHLTLDDNPALSPEIVARYKSMYTGVFYERYIRGRWVAAEGTVYPLFADDPDRYLVDKAPPIHYGIIGVDFGGTGSAHSFTLMGILPGMRGLVLMDEWYHNNKTGGRLSPAQLERAFVDFAVRCKAQCRVQAAYCDSAEQTLIQGLTAAAARERVGIEVKNARKGSINERIAFVNSLMTQGRFLVCRHCTAAIDALRNAVYDPKKPLEDIRLDDGTTNIDSLDSMEYACEPVQGSMLYIGG